MIKSYEFLITVKKITTSARKVILKLNKNNKLMDQKPTLINKKNIDSVNLLKNVIRNLFVKQISSYKINELMKVHKFSEIRMPIIGALLEVNKFVERL